ncbi:MAG: hypothetical protein ACOCSR_01320 [Wenzhouxiangella sp.]
MLERHRGSWLESLFGYPPGRYGPEWLQTHPPTGERIRRLLSLTPGHSPRLPERITGAY